MKSLFSKAPILVGSLLVLYASSSFANVCTLIEKQNKCLETPNAASACGQLLEQDPLDLSARLALCESSLRDRDYANAINTLQQGLDICGKRSTLCRPLRVALSNIDEKRRTQDRKDPAEAQRNADALRGYCEGPIANQRSITACQNLLVSNPKDPTLSLALARKLIKSGQPSSALIYLYKINKSARSGAMNAEISEASKQRKVLVSECLSDSSIANCNLALLPGASDEYQVQRRRGTLHARKKQYRQALRAFLAASSVKPKDAVTARGIIQLKPSSFTTRELKKQLMQAQVKAWRVLNEPDLEKQTLQAFLALNPNDSFAKTRLLALNATASNSQDRLTPIGQYPAETDSEQLPTTTAATPTVASTTASPTPGIEPSRSSDLANDPAQVPVRTEARPRQTASTQAKPNEPSPIKPKKPIVLAINALSVTGQSY